MSVVIETTVGDLTVDLYTDDRPIACLNFLKLCKLKYYNYNLFHKVEEGFIAQTGDPSGVGDGGSSIWGVIESAQKRFFEAEYLPKIHHNEAGLLSLVSPGNHMVGSQFFLTLAPDLRSLDGIHCVIGEVVEGHDVLRILNEALVDENHRPYQDIRITHMVVLNDPFADPRGFQVPSRSPSPSAERLQNGRIAADEDIDDTEGKTMEEIQEMLEEREAKARATILEIVGDIPDADVAPPENVLFVCKLNPVTAEDDLEIIFSRFGKVKSCEVIRDRKTGDSLQYAFVEFEDEKSCETAYFKMDNVLIDDRRIHVDFSQSVAKVKWKGKGRGVEGEIGRLDFNKLGEEPKRKNKNNERNQNGSNRKESSNRMTSEERRKARKERHREAEQRERNKSRSRSRNGSKNYRYREEKHREAQQRERNKSRSSSRNDSRNYRSREERSRETEQKERHNSQSSSRNGSRSYRSREESRREAVQREPSNSRSSSRERPRNYRSREERRRESGQRERNKSRSSSRDGSKNYRSRERKRKETEQRERKKSRSRSRNDSRNYCSRAERQREAEQRDQNKSRSGSRNGSKTNRSRSRSTEKPRSYRSDERKNYDYYRCDKKSPLERQSRTDNSDRDHSYHKREPSPNRKKDKENSKTHDSLNREPHLPTSRNKEDYKSRHTGKVNEATIDDRSCDQKKNYETSQSHKTSYKMERRELEKGQRENKGYEGPDAIKKKDDRTIPKKDCFPKEQKNKSKRPKASSESEDSSEMRSRTPALRIEKDYGTVSKKACLSKPRERKHKKRSKKVSISKKSSGSEDSSEDSTTSDSSSSEEERRKKNKKKQKKKKKSKHKRKKNKKSFS